ncbi:MAG: hypothetical protein Q7J35_07110, partial [Candidatus Methanoperedens sp.]|nr:hypothetical protein [Candidatus Methanoperedens sp.]
FPFDLILRNTRSSPLANSTSLDLYHGSFVRDVNSIDLSLIKAIKDLFQARWKIYKVLLGYKGIFCES